MFSPSSSQCLVTWTWNVYHQLWQPKLPRQAPTSHQTILEGARYFSYVSLLVPTHFQLDSDLESDEASLSV